MKTYTPRDQQGQFESWGKRVDGAGSYAGQDAVVAALFVAAGAALWKFGEWIYEKTKD